MVGGGWKSQNRKIVPFSPYVEKPLNSKVIKSFVPELRSRKCFSCFEIPLFYVYIYEHPMYISHIHVYGYGTLTPEVLLFVEPREILFLHTLGISASNCHCFELCLYLDIFIFIFCIHFQDVFYQNKKKGLRELVMIKLDTTKRFDRFY